MKRAWNAKLRDAFLHHLAESGNVALAARTIGVSRMQVYRMRDRDPAFAEAWEGATVAADEAVEYEARRRALEVTHEPVTCGGEPVLAEDGTPVTVRRYDDRLLAFLLTRKMRCMARYRRNAERLAAERNRQAARQEAFR